MPSGKIFKNPNKPEFKKKSKEEKLEEKEPMKDEEKLYWAKILIALGAAILGSAVIGLVGWWMLLWMVIFWFGVPFLPALAIHEYEKEKWDWKVILKTAVGGYFAIFMLTSTIIHTLTYIANFPGPLPWAGA